MDSSKCFDEKKKIDDNLSNRYIELDPNGYFIIKVDLVENKIVLEHFSNNIDEEGYAPVSYTHLTLPTICSV